MSGGDGGGRGGGGVSGGGNDSHADIGNGDICPIISLQISEV